MYKCKPELEAPHSSELGLLFQCILGLPKYPQQVVAKSHLKSLPVPVQIIAWHPLFPGSGVSRRDPSHHRVNL